VFWELVQRVQSGVRSSHLGKYAVCQLKIERSVEVRSQSKVKSVIEMMS
jgi:hypothetical protein